MPKQHSRRRAPSPDHIPRPTNNWMCFRMTAIAHFRHEGNINEILQKKWHATGPREKQWWTAISRLVKEEHKRRNPGYQFRPRRRRNGEQDVDAVEFRVVTPDAYAQDLPESSCSSRSNSPNQRGRRIETPKQTKASAKTTETFTCPGGLSMSPTLLEMLGGISGLEPHREMLDSILNGTVDAAPRTIAPAVPATYSVPQSTYSVMSEPVALGLYMDPANFYSPSWVDWNVNPQPVSYTAPYVDANTAAWTTPVDYVSQSNAQLQEAYSYFPWP